MTTNPPKASQALEERYYRPFHIASAAAAAIVVLMVTFLASVLDNPPAAETTIRAIRQSAGGLIPYGLYLLIWSFKGQSGGHPSPAWLLNMRQTQAAWVLVIIVWETVAVFEWLNAIQSILPVTIE